MPVLQNLNVLGLIPARGGSKSIPKKNIVSLLGKPLIAYTIEASLASQYISRTIVSTDDAEIAATAKEYGAEVPFLRPGELAQDNTLALPVIQHMVRYLEEMEAWHADIIVYLQPTSPLRRTIDINAAVDILTSSTADSVVSVVEVPHNFSPVSIMQILEGRLKAYLDVDEFILRRQDKPKFYARNGPAVLAITYETLMIKNDLFGEDCHPYIMPPEFSLDVDSSFDLELAMMFLNHHKH